MIQDCVRDTEKELSRSLPREDITLVSEKDNIHDNAAADWDGIAVTGLGLWTVLGPGISLLEISIRSLDLCYAW